MTRWWLPVGGLLVTASLVWWILQVALMAPDERSDASGFGQFVLAAVGLLIVIAGETRKALAPAPAPDLDHLADLLALAMRHQWTEAANDRRLLHPAPLPIRWRRTTEPVAGPTDAATLTGTDHVGFAPLPGLKRVTSGRLRSGTRRNLHQVYGGLASGRLLIIGGPGTGKSSAAVLLLLDALNYRDHADPNDRPRIPVPVMFTLQNWDPATTSVDDWLSTKLTEIPVFRGRHGKAHARSLLRAGRIAVFLDGLDEIPPQTQPVALSALSQQAAHRLVLLSRTHNLRAAAEDRGLVGAVALEVQPLKPTDVANYLLRPLTEPAPAAWHHLTTTLTTRPDSTIALALTTPLTVSLVHDIYQPSDPVDELCDTTRFPHPHDITNHLLDHAITAAYAPRPGQPTPRYTAHTAHRTLTLIAYHLNQDRTRDLTWWHIPTWTPRTPRAVSAALLMATLTAPTIGLVAGSGAGLMLWLTVGLVLALIESALKHPPSTPLRGTPISWRRLRTRDNPASWLVSGFLAEFAAMMTTEVSGADSTSPIRVWRRDFLLWLAFGLGGGLLVGLVAGIAAGLVAGIAAGLETGIESGLVVGILGVLGVQGAATQQTAIAQIYLAVRYHTPLRLIRFLEDARSRHLLRTVGPIYQLRHAVLQDRLAATPMHLATNFQTPPPSNTGHSNM